MKKAALILVIWILLPVMVDAHPGNTASDGCHYCRTNCDRWGRAWNKRHCHGGGSSSSSSGGSSGLSTLLIVGGLIYVSYLGYISHKVDKEMREENRKGNNSSNHPQDYSDVKNCPRCGSRMVLRMNNKTGSKFYGCSRYPRCNGTRKRS